MAKLAYSSQQALAGLKRRFGEAIVVSITLGLSRIEDPLNISFQVSMNQTNTLYDPASTPEARLTS